MDALMHACARACVHTHTHPTVYAGKHECRWARTNIYTGARTHASTHARPSCAPARTHARTCLRTPARARACAQSRAHQNAPSAHPTCAYARRTCLRAHARCCDKGVERDGGDASSPWGGLVGECARGAEGAAKRPGLAENGGSKAYIVVALCSYCLYSNGLWFR